MQRRELLKSFLGMLGIPFVGVTPSTTACSTSGPTTTTGCDNSLSWLWQDKPYNIIPMGNWEIKSARWERNNDILHNR